MNINSKETKKPLLILLILIAVIVWGNFLFRVKGNFTREAIENTQAETRLEGISGKGDNFNVTFTGDFRDPFHKTNQPAIKKPEPPKKPKRPNKRLRDKTPAITLRGIVGKTAMLEMKNQLYFMQQGDSLGGGKLVSVYRDSLIIDFKTKKDTLRVRK